MNAKPMTAHASLARTGMAWAEIAELSASTWATLVVNIDCLGGLHTHTHADKKLMRLATPALNAF